jgi:3-oxoacyl-[acyl-carrier-protein] synthase-1
LENKIMPIFLNSLGIVCAIGDNKSRVLTNFLQGNGHYMQQSDRFGVDTVIGEVTSQLPNMDAFPAHHKTRNNQLALLAFNQLSQELEQLKEKLKGSLKTKIKIAVVIGTSTSGIASGEQSMGIYLQSGKHQSNYHYAMQEMGAPAEFIAQLAEANTSVYAISTACTSSAKALISGQRLLDTGMADIVIAGGVDSLCKMTINGFNSLESISNDHTLPFQQARAGINIGEGCALFVMSKSPADIELKGYGESSDAHHISAPDPQGSGAIMAIKAALNSAKLQSSDIDYINLHGTGTVQNDAMEAIAVNHVFPETTVCTASKQLHGHCLGAAGAIEAGLCWLLLSKENEKNSYPQMKLLDVIDPNIAKITLNINPVTSKQALNYCMSNSYAFGGNNASLVLAKSTTKKLN